MAYCYRHPDRETGLSCTECERPICTECMTMTPVGPRCPDHAYAGPAGTVGQRVRMSMPRTRGAPYVTWGLVAANVLVYLVTVAQGAGINRPGGKLFADWLLFGPAVAAGDWWRLLTAAFLHGNLVHIGFNMFVLYWLGTTVETFLGPLRYLALYVVSGLAGSAGALVANPNDLTVGASGAIFGIMGALLIIEYQQTGQLAGQAMSLIAVNLIFTFAFASTANISYGGHVGGLIGGVAASLALARFGRGHVAYGRPGVIGLVGLLAVAVASVAISYWKVRGYA